MNKYNIPDGIYIYKQKLKDRNLFGIVECKNNVFILKEGSILSEPMNSMCDTYKKLRSKLVLDSNNRLLEDVYDINISAAACLVQGGSKDGWICFKDKDGLCLDIYRN